MVFSQKMLLDSRYATHTELNLMGDSEIRCVKRMEKSELKMPSNGQGKMTGDHSSVICGLSDLHFHLRFVYRIIKMANYLFVFSSWFILKLVFKSSVLISHVIILFSLIPTLFYWCALTMKQIYVQ